MLEPPQNPGRFKVVLAYLKSGGIFGANLRPIQKYFYGIAVIKDGLANLKPISFVLKTTIHVCFSL